MPTTYERTKPTEVLAALRDAVLVVLRLRLPRVRRRFVFWQVNRAGRGQRC